MSYKTRPQLLEENERLQKELEALRSSGGNVVTELVSDERDLRPDDFIYVMSLCPNRLNLGTSTKRGKFKFDKFGQVKRIVYSDLVEVIEEQQKFLESGLFYILDERVVKAHGLQDLYEDILSKETIEKLLSGDLEENGVELFQRTSSKQQEIIIEMLISKLVKDEHVDMNFVNELERISGVKIAQKAQEAKEYLKMGN